MIPTDSNIALVLCIVHILSDGAQKMHFNDFADALARSTHADRQYSRAVFNRFQDDPAGFLATRSPQSQSVEIIRAILSRSNKSTLDTESNSNTMGSIDGSPASAQ